MNKKSILKRNILVLTGSLISIIAPIVLTSCSTNNQPPINNGIVNKPENNKPNSGNNNSNNNGNIDGTNGSNNNSNESNANAFIDKEKNPELFLSKHLFTYDDLIKMTPLEIHQKTPLYQSSLKNLNYLLKKENIDFININGIETINKVYSWYKEIGIVGEIGENDKDKVKNTPNIFGRNDLLTQKYLDKFSKENINVQELDFAKYKEKINEIILSNPFGYLPSNLNQLIYYLSIEDISKLFNLNNLKNVYANHNDKNGNIDIYFEKNDNGISKINVNSTNSNLKKDDDFLQYIFDRTFFIQANFWKFERQNPYDWFNFSLTPKVFGGTMWIIDRINNETLNNDTYEFLVGTNLHVLDFSPFFEKNNRTNRVVNKYWDGGFRDWGAKGSTTNTEDIIEKLTNSNDSIINTKGSVDVFNKKQEDISPIYMKMGTNVVKDVSKIDVDSIDLKNDYESNIEWGSNKYIDLVWYTPTFTSSGVRTTNGGEDEIIFGENLSGDRIGTVTDGGADFAVAKIKMKKNQIDKLLPKLGSILGTNDEKDWYIGLGKKEHIIANQTIYVGGYPEFNWNYSKSIGGRVTSKTRHVTSDFNVVRHWTKFNKEVNDIRNKKFSSYKEYEDNHQPYYKGKNGKRKFEHGMKLSNLVQNSILNTSANRYLLGGASGSMAIDSKFNLVGALFNGITNSIDEPFYTNGIGLMDSQSQYDNWDGSIRNDILKKIKEENLYTIKINPKNIINKN